MVSTGLIALLDDIASILDDVSALTKVAASKTAAVVGDDLAVNAQQVSGVRAERELPVVWAVAKGSTVNKAILVPAALAISALAPWAVTPLLMAGGLFLCYEAFEKVVERKRRSAGASAEPTQVADQAAAGDPAEREKAKIRGAVRTDFILSAEIIVIALGTVAGASFVTQVAVLVGIAVMMTVGVYGLVAAIVKLDDVGLWLTRRPGDDTGSRVARASGTAILAAAPRFMRSLAILGTIAMFLVGGGILAHGIGPLADAVVRLADALRGVPSAGNTLAAVAPYAAYIVVGFVAGALALGGVALVRKAAGSRPHA